MKLHRDKNKNKNKILKKQVGGDTRSNLKVAKQNQEEEQRLRKNPVKKKKETLERKRKTKKGMADRYKERESCSDSLVEEDVG